MLDRRFASSDEDGDTMKVRATRPGPSVIPGGDGRAHQ